MKHTNESIDRLDGTMAYYCKKEKLPLLKRILNRLAFWKPRIDYVITDLQPNHFAINRRVTETLEEGE